MLRHTDFFFFETSVLNSEFFIFYFFSRGRSVDFVLSLMGEIFRFGSWMINDEFHDPWFL